MRRLSAEENSQVMRFLKGVLLLERPPFYPEAQRKIPQPSADFAPVPLVQSVSPVRTLPFEF